MKRHHLVIMLLTGVLISACAPVRCAGRVCIGSLFGLALDQASVSPSGRYHLIPVFTPTDAGGYNRFIVTDTVTGLWHVEALNSSSDWIARAARWTHDERYLVFDMDGMISSHDCNEYLFFTPDGTDLVYRTERFSSWYCVMGTDDAIQIIAICPHDEVVFGRSVSSVQTRVALLTGAVVTQGETLDMMGCDPWHSG